MKKILTWEEYFIAIAKVTAMRSKDPNTKVGAVIVNDDNVICGLGYNGMPKGDDSLPWDKEGDAIDTKYKYVVHAEMNAILNTNLATLKGTRMFVTLFPCSTCAKFIIQSGIKEIYYSSSKYDGTEDNIVSKKIFDKLGIKYINVKDVEVIVN
ncbi:MAG: dCMP deaminase family protein [Mycoplasma sp.]|nr:dCMP deaminase family protein [Mycoplasma sp.]